MSKEFETLPTLKPSELAVASIIDGGLRTIEAVFSDQDPAGFSDREAGSQLKQQLSFLSSLNPSIDGELSTSQAGARQIKAVNETGDNWLVQVEESELRTVISWTEEKSADPSSPPPLRSAELIFQETQTGDLNVLLLISTKGVSSNDTIYTHTFHQRSLVDCLGPLLIPALFDSKTVDLVESFQRITEVLGAPLTSCGDRACDALEILRESSPGKGIDDNYEIGVMRGEDLSHVIILIDRKWAIVPALRNRPTHVAQVQFFPDRDGLRETQYAIITPWGPTEVIPISRFPEIARRVNRRHNALIGGVSCFEGKPLTSGEMVALRQETNNFLADERISPEGRLAILEAHSAQEIRLISAAIRGTPYKTKDFREALLGPQSVQNLLSEFLGPVMDTFENGHLAVDWVLEKPLDFIPRLIAQRRDVIAITPTVAHKNLFGASY